MQAKGSRIEIQAGGLPETRKRPHLVGPPTIDEFQAAVTRLRKAAIGTTTGRVGPLRVSL
jgi:hypothetical protein